MKLDPFKNLSDEDLEIKFKAVSNSVAKKLEYQEQIKAEIEKRKQKQGGNKACGF